MGQSLILSVKGKDVEFPLPDPQSLAARELFACMPRMESWLPARQEEEKVQFMMAISSAANMMPKNATKGSLCKAAFNAAALGLMPNTAHNYCYFVPITRHRGTNKERVDVELWMGYKGYLELAYACGYLGGITTEVILEITPHRMRVATPATLPVAIRFTSPKAPASTAVVMSRLPSASSVMSLASASV